MGVLCLAAWCVAIATHHVAKHNTPITTVNFHRFHSFCPKETALRHVLRWCNLAKERPCFRPPCCQPTESRALFCKWLNTSTGTVNTTQCTSSCLSRLPHNLKIAFIFLITLVYSLPPVITCGLGSSVGIAVDCGLDGSGIEFRLGARFFAHAKTSPGA